MTTQPTPQQPDFSEISTQIPQFMKTAAQAACLGGQRLIHWLGQVNVREKSPGDYVTQADLDSQTAIFDFLKSNFPAHHLVGEETLPNDAANVEGPGSADSAAIDPGPAPDASPFRWIIDPLDGTTNFIHGLQSFSVSIALTWNGQLIAACVHDPLLDETFVAGRHAGATRNGKRISPSRCDSIDRALLTVSFPSAMTRDSVDLERFVRMLCHTRASIRRLGSAALNLCYVADGRLDGYWASSLHAWDVAAGALILQESGGAIRHLSGAPFDLADPQIIAACHEPMLAEMLRVLHTDHSPSEH